MSDEERADALTEDLTDDPSGVAMVSAGMNRMIREGARAGVTLMRGVSPE